MRHARNLAVVLLAAALPLAASAQNLDISGWSLDQTSSTQTYTIPDGTSVVPGSYVIICRDVDQAARRQPVRADKPCHPRRSGRAARYAHWRA